MSEPLTPAQSAGFARRGDNDDELARLLADVRRIADGVGAIHDLAVRVVHPEQRTPSASRSVYIEALVEVFRLRVKRAEQRGEQSIAMDCLTVTMLLDELQHLERDR